MTTKALSLKVKDADKGLVTIRQTKSPSQLRLLGTERDKCCARCETWRPRDEFGGAAKRKDGLRPYCRDCERAVGRESYQRNKTKVAERTMAWHRAHPESARESTRRWRNKNKVLLTARKKIDYAAHKPQIDRMLRDNAYRRKYGVSLAERDAMAAAQGGRCAICKRHESELSRRLAVDHCHVTGSIRELLCESCNLGLGFFGDDHPRLLSAAQYLVEHGSLNIAEAMCLTS